MLPRISMDRQSETRPNVGLARESGSLYGLPTRTLTENL
jgi:hypothetical protein